MVDESLNSNIIHESRRALERHAEKKAVPTALGDSQLGLFSAASGAGRGLSLTYLTRNLVGGANRWWSSRRWYHLTVQVRRPYSEPKWRRGDSKAQQGWRRSFIP